MSMVQASFFRDPRIEEFLDKNFGKFSGKNKSSILESFPGIESQGLDKRNFIKNLDSRLGIFNKMLKVFNLSLPQTSISILSMDNSKKDSGFGFSPSFGGFLIAALFIFFSLVNFDGLSDKSKDKTFNLGAGIGVATFLVSMGTGVKKEIKDNIDKVEKTLKEDIGEVKNKVVEVDKNVKDLLELKGSVRTLENMAKFKD